MTRSSRWRGPRRVRRSLTSIGVMVSVSSLAPLVGPTPTAAAPTDVVPAGSLAQAERLSLRGVTCGAQLPVNLGYDPFYIQYCNASGLPVLASAAVDPSAVREAAEIAQAMIGHRPDLIAAMTTRGMRIGVIGATELTTDMPEYRDLYTLFPGVDWNTRARGLGATPFIPLSSVGEENVSCLAGDVYVGDSIMVHEFAHSIRLMGLVFVDPAFNLRIENAYAHAMSIGLWSNTYAATNSDEYFAETAQSYLNAHVVGPAGGNGIHNNVATRPQLAAYDPLAYQLLDELFGGAAPLGTCA